MCGNFSFGDYFKERGDPARVGAAHHVGRRRRLRPRPREALDHRLPRRRRGRGHLAPPDRCPARAHPAPRHGRELLVHGRARSVRAVLGDQLRPGPGVRRRGRPGSQRRALPRDLEPRLHAVRARRGLRQGGLPDPGRPAGQEHRHRHGPRADGRRPAGRRQPLRDRHQPGDPRPRERADRARLPRGPHRRRTPADRDRPRAYGGDADRRRRDARQRGPRLRAAPDHAPRGPLDAPAGRARTGLRRARRREHRRRVPGRSTRSSPTRLGRIRAVCVAEEESFLATLQQGTKLFEQFIESRRDPVGGAWRRRVPAARHARLPDRPHPRDGGGEGPVGSTPRASAG